LLGVKLACGDARAEGNCQTCQQEVRVPRYRTNHVISLESGKYAPKTVDSDGTEKSAP